jgi:hypothetical protein
LISRQNAEHGRPSNAGSGPRHPQIFKSTPECEKPRVPSHFWEKFGREMQESVKLKEQQKQDLFLLLVRLRGLSSFIKGKKQENFFIRQKSGPCAASRDRTELSRDMITLIK